MEPIKFGIGSFGSVPDRTEKTNSTQNSCNSMFSSKFWQHFSRIAHKTTMTNITVKQSNKYINRVLTSKVRHQHSARVQDIKTTHYYTIFGSSVSSVNRGGTDFTEQISVPRKWEPNREPRLRFSVNSVRFSIFRFSSRLSIKFAQD